MFTVAYTLDMDICQGKSGMVQERLWREKTNQPNSILHKACPEFRWMQ
jgi:hypothetical protein